MTERELKCISQRIQVNIDNHEDAVSLYREVRALRDTLREVRDMTGDRAIWSTIDGALSE